MQIIPAVDVLNGSVVRLLRGRYDEVTTYSADPVEAARRWMSDGASLVHVVDLGGARTGEADSGLLHSLGASDVAFQIGGGIRDAEIAMRALEAGADRVVVGTAAVHDAGILEAIVDVAGGGRVVAAIDVRGGMARGSGWTDAGAPLDDVIGRVVASGVEVALVTGIERDGAMDGPNVDLLAEVRTMAPDLGLIASGGIGSLDDIVALRGLGCDGAIVGRALYEGRFGLPQAIEAGER